jgi:hypothetical protein
MDNEFKDTVTHISELLQETFSGYFNAVYEGLPSSTPPEAAYPLLIVHKMDSGYEVGATMTDDFEEVILIVVMENRMDEVGSDMLVDTTMRKLEQKIEGKDPQTGGFKQGTLMYALRNNLTLDTTVIDSSAAISYNGTQQTGGAFLAEADIRLTLTERVSVANRH